MTTPAGKVNSASQIRGAAQIREAPYLAVHGNNNKINQACGHTLNTKPACLRMTSRLELNHNKGRV